MQAAEVVPTRQLNVPLTLQTASQPRLLTSRCRLDHCPRQDSDPMIQSELPAQPEHTLEKHACTIVHVLHVRH
jgi:hypothetical protein